MILSPYIQPVDTPVSPDAAKLHQRISISTDDELIKIQLAAAASWCEKYEGQSYMMKSFKGYLDHFPNEIIMPYPPLVTVSSIQYVDSNGDTQTLASSVYTVDADSFPARIYLAYGQSWPVTQGIPKAVTITFTTGYSTTFTAAASDIVTVGNAVFADADIVRITTDQADLPSPLAVGTDYHVRDVSGSTLKLAATAGGAAIDITDAGTGTHYIGFAERGNVPDSILSAIKLLFGHLYEHRENELDGRTNVCQFASKNLLNERVWF